MKENAERMQESEIDLLELFFYLLHRWKVILLAFVICGVIAMLGNYYLISPTYKASAELYIPNTGNVIDFQDIQLSSELTVDYEEILLSRTVLKKVIRQQRLDIDYSTLKKMISITNPQDSHCLVLTVECGTPEDALRISNSLMKIGIDQIYRIVGKDEPAVIDAAEADAIETIKPSMAKYGMIGALLGILAVCAYYILQYMMDTTLKTEEEVERYLQLSVLSVIPEIMEKSQKEQKPPKSYKSNKRYTRIYRRK